MYVIEPRVLAYALPSQRPSVTTEEARPTEYHHDERVVAGPEPTLFSYAYIAACNQGEFAYLQIAGGEEGLTTLALPHLLTLANVSCVKASRRLSRADNPVSHPKGTPLRRADIYKFHPITYT